MAPIRQFAAILKIGKRDQDIMLIAYLDESYDGSIFALGGFVAWQTEWRKVEKKWKTVIRANQIKRFHASDCNNGFGEFDSWPRERRVGLTKRLLRVLMQHKLYGVFSGVIQRDFRELSGIQNPDAPYLLCFQACVQQIVNRMSELPPDVKVHLIVDMTNSKGKLVENHNWMKFERVWDGRDRLGLFTLAPWQDIVPLQCADLIVYEAFKELKRSLFEPKRDMRKSYLKLSSKIPIWGAHFEHEGLLRLKKALEAKQQND